MLFLNLGENEFASKRCEMRVCCTPVVFIEEELVNSMTVEIVLWLYGYSLTIIQINSTDGLLHAKYYSIHVPFKRTYSTKFHFFCY